MSVTSALFLAITGILALDACGPPPISPCRRDCQARNDSCIVAAATAEQLRWCDAHTQACVQGCRP